MLKKFVFKKISTSSKLHRYVNKVRKLYHARYICNGKRDPKIINLNKMTIPKKAYLLRQVCFAGCRLQVAGWNLIIAGKPLALKWNVQAVDLYRDCYMIPFTIVQQDCFHLMPNRPKRWIIGIEQTSEISSEIAAGFGFFPVSTKMKARRACTNIFRQLKSYIISFLYLLGNLLLFREFIVFFQLCESYAQICEFPTKLRCWEESRTYSIQHWSS